MAAKEKDEKETDKAKKAIQKPAPTRPVSPFEAMDQLFGSYCPSGWMRPFRMEWPEWSGAGAPFEGKSPKVDVIDRDKEVVVKAELPGVNKEDIDVSVQNNTVTIKATTSHEEKEEKGDYYRCEMSRGSFARTVMLPAEVDEAKAEASFKNGVLELTLAKLKESKRHTIKVS